MWTWGIYHMDAKKIEAKIVAESVRSLLFIYSLTFMKIRNNNNIRNTYILSASHFYFKPPYFT